MSNALSTQKPTSQADCAFQYYAGGRMIEDTGLITREKADELMKKHAPDFTARCKLGEDDAEMALWVNMKHEIHYHETSLHVRSGDVIIKGGVAYRLERVF